MTTKGRWSSSIHRADSHVAIVDVKAKDADAPSRRVAAYQPGFKRAQDRPAAGAEGRLDERKAFQYETSPNERACDAYAWRAGDAWTVVIVDGTEPTFEKRGAPLGLTLQSLRPRVCRESFAGRRRIPGREALATLKDFVAAA